MPCGVGATRGLNPQSEPGVPIWRAYFLQFLCLGAPAVQRPHFVLVSTRACLGPESKPGPVLEAPPPRVCEGSDTGSRVGLLRGRLARPAPLLPTVVPLEQECGLFPVLPVWPPPRISATQTQRDSGHLLCPLRTHCLCSRPRLWHWAGAGVLGVSPSHDGPPMRILLQGPPGCYLTGHREGPRRGSGGQGHGAGVAQ